MASWRIIESGMVARYHRCERLMTKLDGDLISVSKKAEACWQYVAWRKSWRNRGKRAAGNNGINEIVTQAISICIANATRQRANASYRIAIVATASKRKRHGDGGGDGNACAGAGRRKHQNAA